MKITLITQITPASDNIRGTSALPYHLMIHRPDNIDITIYSFNGNNISAEKKLEVERELNVNMKIINHPQWLKYILKFHLLIIRILLNYPLFNYIKLPRKIVNEIINSEPEGIWFYGQDISRVIKQFPNYKRVHTLPDCESLYYYRMLGQRFIFNNRMNLWRNIIIYPKYLRMESHYEKGASVKYSLVGDADMESLRNVNPGIQAYFIRHPHYNITVPQKVISFSQPKIRILIAGQYNLYMKTAFDEILPTLCKHKELAQHYSITFLGRGWDFAVEKLSVVGYESKRLDFVDVYADEIIKYDIQMTPISVGTGTKGKVLDAIANGLLVIGTPYAMENIAVKSGKSCIVYSKPEELIESLDDIYNNVTRYELIAENGRQAVLKYHDRAMVSKQLFSLFN
jgi:hypothetical protein